MENYRIKVKVEIAECAESELRDTTKREDGSFEMTISEKEAISIDKCENALLKTVYESMREAISRHLTEVSKKKPFGKELKEN